MDYIFDNERPIYIQLVELIKKYIASGQIKPGEKIQSVREFASTFKVNPNTVQKALQELENDKLIFTERTNGKFVTDDELLIKEVKKKFADDLVINYLDNMKSLGFDKKEAIKYLEGKE